MGGQTRRAGVRRHARLLRFLLVVGVLAAPASFPLASAGFSTSSGNGGNSVGTAEVAAPSGLTATQQCAVRPVPTFRSTSSDTGTNSITLDVPSGTTAGDAMVAVVSNRDSFPLPTPSGWNLVRRDTVGGIVTTAVYWRIATSSEPSVTFTLTGASTSAMIGGLLSYTGASATAPVHTSGVASGTTAAATTPVLTTTTANTRLLHVLVKREGTLPAPGGTTSLGSTSIGSPTQLGLTAATETFPGPGTTTARSSTASAAGEWVATSIAIRPPAPAPSAALTWTPTPSTWATGYVLDRIASGSVQASQTITPRSTASATDGPLVNGTAYTYRLLAYRGTWTSSEVTVSLTPSC